MANGIILVLVVLLLLFAVKGTVKHFKGEGPCCGGGRGGEIPEQEKKLAAPVIGRMTLHIEGMHCQHCVNTVTRSLNRIDGVSARVSLKDGRAVVSYDRKLDGELLRRTVEDAGYQVVSVEG